MRQFYLLGVLAVFLTGCLSPQVNETWRAKVDAKRETDLIFQIRSAQEEYATYLKARLAACQVRSEVLTRDLDGVLVCAAPAKKTEGKE